MSALPDPRKQAALHSTERTKPSEDTYERAIRDLHAFKQQITALERVQQDLRAQIASTSEKPSYDALRVLVHLFQTEAMGHRDVGVIARKLGLARSAVQDHLDRLRALGLAESALAHYRLGQMYWGLTPQGRQYVVEHKLSD